MSAWCWKIFFSLFKMLEPHKTHPRINPPTNRKNGHPLLVKVLFYILLAAFLGTTTYFLFFSGKLNITSVRISGTKNISQSDILAEVKTQLAGKYLKFLAKSNILLVRDNKIQSDLERHFRLIENVTVQKKFPDILMVNIFERTPTMVVCAPNCFVLDENGTAYDQADPNVQSFKARNLVTLTVEGGLNVTLNQKNVLTKDYTAYILALGQRLKSALNLEIEPVYQTPNPMAEEVDVKTKQDWSIYFNTQIPLDKEIQMLQAVLQNEISPDQQNNLEYIDLRIDNKVYYKFKNSNSNTEANQNGNNNSQNNAGQVGKSSGANAGKSSKGKNK